MHYEFFYLHCFPLYYKYIYLMYTTVTETCLCPLSLQEDPAITQWMYARANPYQNFRPTPKTSLLGFMFSVVPIFGFWYLFKTSRVRDNTNQHFSFQMSWNVKTTKSWSVWLRGRYLCCYGNQSAVCLLFSRIGRRSRSGLGPTSKSSGWLIELLCWKDLPVMFHMRSALSLITE